MPGDPEVNTTEVNEVQPVLSHEDKPLEASASDNPESGKEKTPEQKKKDDTWAKQRIANREWRKNLRANPQELLEEAAKELGFDTEKEENKNHLKVISAFEQKKTNRDMAIRSNASNMNITDSLVALGIKPESAKGYALGNLLLRKYGTENPDVFQDHELIKREMSVIAEEFTGKKDPVGESILKKVSSNLPQVSSPKGTSAPTDEKKMAAEAAAMGVSPEKYKSISEKQKLTPKWA